MKKQRLIGAIVSYVNILLSIVIGFITAPMLLSAFGKSEYGAYQMAVSLIGYMSVLDLGLHNVTTRFVAKYAVTHEEEEQENFIFVNILLFMIIAVIILITGAVLYHYVPNIYAASSSRQEIKIIRKLVVVLTLNLAVSMPGAVFASIITAYEKFVFQKLLLTAKMAVRLLTIIAVLNFGGRSFEIAMVDFIINLLIILIHMWFCFTKIKIRIRYHYINKQLLGSIFSFSAFVFLAAITDQINWKVDTTVIGILLGPATVTLYSVAANLITLYRSFTGAISGVFLPYVTKMVATGSNECELTDVMIRVGRIQLMIVGLIWCGFLNVGRDFIGLWMGKEYVDAALLFVVLAAPLVIPMTQSIGINILEAKRMHQFRAIVYFFIALANIVLTIFLTRYAGAFGAAFSTGITLLIGNNIIMNWYYAKKVHLEIGRFFLETFGKLLPLQAAAGILGYFACRLMPETISWLVIGIKAGIIAVIYAVVLLGFGLDKAEKQQLRRILGRKRA